MDGPAFVKWIETTLIQNDITKETFYAESGISTANMTQWRAGDYNPSKKSIEKAKRFFEAKQKEKPAATEDDELMETILGKLLQLSDEERLLVSQMVDGVIDAKRNKTTGGSR